MIGLFQESITTAVRWVTRYTTTADFAFALRGDCRSGRIEAQRDYMLGLICRTPDITLLEIHERLIQNCGEWRRDWFASQLGPVFS